MCLIELLLSFPGGSAVNNRPASAGDMRLQVYCLGQEDPLEKETATYASILAWDIPRTEEPDGLQSTGSQKDSDMTVINNDSKLLFNTEFGDYRWPG